MNDTNERITPSVFAGSATWHYAYCLSTGFQQRYKTLYVDWIKLMVYLFICEKCSVHGQQTLSKHNILNYTQTRDRFYLYISQVLQEGANDNKKLPMSQRPNYFKRKSYFFNEIVDEDSAFEMSIKAMFHMLFSYATNFEHKNKQKFEKFVRLTLSLFPKADLMWIYEKHNIDKYLSTPDRAFLYVYTLADELTDVEDYFHLKKYYFESLFGMCKSCEMA